MNSEDAEFWERYRRGNSTITDWAAPRGLGMSMFSVLLAWQAARQNKKVIMMDTELSPAPKSVSPYNFNWDKYGYIWGRR